VRDQEIKPSDGKKLTTGAHPGLKGFFAAREGEENQNTPFRVGKKGPNPSEGKRKKNQSVLTRRTVGEKSGKLKTQVAKRMTGLPGKKTLRIKFLSEKEERRQN